MRMNQDAVINRLAHITGKSRKEVINALKEFGSIPMVRKELERMRNGQKRRKKAS